MISTKKLIYFIIILSVLIDVLNGIFFRISEGFSISLFYKATFFLLILLICLNNKYLSKYSFFSFIVIVPIIYHILNLKFDITELQWAIRILTLNLSLDFLIRNYDIKYIKKYFTFTYFILLLTILLWLFFGLGYNQYSKKV